jgi:hypothetical protein
MSPTTARRPTCTPTGFAPENLPPVAVLDQQADGKTVVLDASGSHDPEGEIVEHRWLLGHGTILTGATVTHTYTKPGTHYATLVVIDDEGAMGFADAEPVTVVASDYEFDGFHAPVSSDEINDVTAGQTIPLKWSLPGEDPAGLDDGSQHQAVFRFRP